MLNRGVDRRDIFIDEKDYVRFVHNLYVFNDTAPADCNTGYFFKSKDIVSPYMQRTRERLVEIHGWCLMKNHYRLLLSELVANGISLFLRKLNVGYAKSFNEKYKRTGTLFQGRTKKIHTDRDAQFNYILHYIHLNPLDYLSGAERWRERDHAGIHNAAQALHYLGTYRWSSYLDYARGNNFPSILTTSFFNETFSNYSQSLKHYLSDAEMDFAQFRLE